MFSTYNAIPMLKNTGWLSIMEKTAGRVRASFNKMLAGTGGHGFQIPARAGLYLLYLKINNFPLSSKGSKFVSNIYFCTNQKKEGYKKLLRILGFLEYKGTNKLVIKSFSQKDMPLLYQSLNHLVLLF